AGSQSVEKLTTKLGGVSDQLAAGAAGLPEIVASLQRVATRLDRLVEGVDLLVDDNRDDVRRTLAQFQASARELELLVERLERNPSDLILSAPQPERERGASPAGKPDKGGS